MEEKYTVDMYNAMLRGHEWKGELDLLHTTPELGKEKSHSENSSAQLHLSSPAGCGPGT